MELRKDYILDKFVIISENRTKRPNEFIETAVPASSSVSSSVSSSQSSSVTSSTTKGTCVFCPGNESLTPPTIGQIGSPWNMRWFENKFAFLKPFGNAHIQTDNTYFTYSDAFGYHEIIVETNDHEKLTSDLSEDEISKLLVIFSERITELSKKPYIKYVQVFKNHGKDAGTSLRHEHMQIAALNHIPWAIREKLEAVARYDHCPYCDIVSIERASFRRCYENDFFSAFTPYASRFSYEIWLFPKKHVASITQLDGPEIKSLSQILKKTLLKMKEMNVSYNLFIHNSPESLLGENKNLHFHICVCPRIAVWAGLEISDEIIVNAVSPEDAAKFYRGENL